MEIFVRGDKIKVTKAIQDYAQEKLGRIEKYLGGATENILVVKIRKRETVSLTMKWTSGGNIHKNRVQSKRSKLYELGTVCLQF